MATSSDFGASPLVLNALRCRSRNDAIWLANSAALSLLSTKRRSPFENDGEPSASIRPSSHAEAYDTSIIAVRSSKISAASARRKVLRSAGALTVNGASGPRYHASVGVLFSG